MAIYRPYGDTDYKYGDTARFYGVGDNDNLIWGVSVDWDGDGVFDGSNEAERVIGIDISNGRPFYLQLNSDGEATGFQRVNAARMNITLNNYDDRYNYWNRNSPIYPNVAPGKDIRVRVRNGSTGTIEPLFYGRIDKITPISGARPKVILRCSGTLKYLAETSANVKLHESVTRADAINAVLDNVEWATRWGREIDSSTSTIPYWWASGRALTEVNDLAESDLGVVFGAEDGKIKYYNKYHVGAVVLSLTQEQLGKNIEAPAPYESVRNKIRVYASTREKKTVSVIWELGESLALSAGQEKEYWCQYSYGGAETPAADVIEPIATTDYQMNSSADFSGTDLTSDLSVVEFSDFGDTAKLVIKNNGSLTGYVKIQIRGAAIVEVSNTFAEASAGAGDRLLTLRLNQLQSYAQASDFAVWLLTVLNDEVIYPVVRLRGKPDIQFTPKLFDTVNLTLDALGLATTAYRVGYITHKSVAETLQDIQTEIHFEPYRIAEGFWTFPVKIGIDTIFGV